MVQTLLTPNDLAKFLRNTGNSLIVVDAFATWCGPCKALTPKLDELERKYANRVRFLKFDVDTMPSLADQFQISSLPTLLFIKNSREIDRVSGFDPSKIERTIEKHLSTQNR